MVAASWSIFVFVSGGFGVDCYCIGAVLDGD